MAALSRLWLRTVDGQFRVRIGADVAEVVPWLTATAGFHTEAVGFLGPHGQFQVADELPGANTLDGLKKSLSETKMSPHESTTNWSLHAQFAAMSWPVSFSFEKSSNRFAFGFPEDPREFGILPSSGRVAVYAISGVLEVWKLSEWLAHVQTVSTDIQKVITNASKELRER